MPTRKLSDGDVAELLKLRASGSSLNDLAAAFGVTPQHVGRLIRGSAADVAGDGSHLTLEEAEQLLANAARKGSIGALKLWFERHASDRADDDGDDPLLDFVPRSHGGRG